MVVDGQCSTFLAMRTCPTFEAAVRAERAALGVPLGCLIAMVTIGKDVGLR